MDLLAYYDDPEMDLSEENGYLDDQRVSFGSLSSDRRIALFYYMEE